MLTYATKYNGEPIEEDKSLQPCEKETGLHFSNASKEVHINTHQGTIIRHLLSCDYFKVTELEFKGKKTRKVIGLSGILPLSSLRIDKPKKNQLVSAVVIGKIALPLRRKPPKHGFSKLGVH